MQKKKQQCATAAALAVAAVMGTFGAIDALSRTRLAETVVTLPRVEIVAVRTTAAAPEHAVR